MSTPKRIKYKGQIYEAVVNEGKAYKPVDSDEIYRAVNGILLKAFVQAEDIFEKYDEGELNDIISDGYPFDKSFAEMVWEVLDWRDNVREKTGHIAESVEDATLNESSEMRKYTQRELRDMIRTGMAKELTSFADRPKDFDKVGYSSGTYGINGGLIQDRETGEYYVIPDRSSLLLRIF